MARKRMIDPEFWLDEEMARQSPYARLLYIGLWGLCDDNYATFPNQPGWIRVQVFPYNTDVNIEELLSELLAIKKLIPFNHEGQEYFFIKNFFKYQRVDRPSKAKYPKFKEEAQRILVEGSTNTRSEAKLSKAKLSKANSNDKPKEKNGVHQLVDFFFKLKGWDNLSKDDYAKRQIIYARHVKPAQNILELCDGDLEMAKDKILRIATWADNEELDWSLETIIKKWFDIEKLPQEKKKKAQTEEGFPAYKRGEKWFCIMPSGEHKEVLTRYTKIVYA